MLFDKDKFLSLSELHEEIKKSRRETRPMVKSDVPVKAYDKQVGAQRVHVRTYRQSRKDAAAPALEIPGPKAHFAQKTEQESNIGGIKPTIAATKAVSCPMCNSNVGTKGPEQGEKETFQYMKPKNPFEGRESHEISLEDVAHGIHRTPLLGHDEFNAMSDDEKQKHLKSHAFIHLTPEANVALHREIKKIIRPRFESVGRWMQLHRLGTQYDPETLVDDFTHRVIDEMTRHRRANSKFGYKKEEELQKNPPPGGMPQLQYHMGMDTQNVYSDKDLAREARVRAPWWAKRFFFKEAGGKGFEHLIGGEKGPAFQQSQLMGKIYKIEHKIDELKKESGFATQSPQIHTSISYGLQELQQLAAKAGYMLEKETAPDGSLKRVLLFEEDPSVLQTFGMEPKFGTPKFEVDFDKGGKVNDVRNKLAELVNPAEGFVDTPLHNYIKLHDQFNQGKDKLKELHKQTDILKEKYERYSEEPAAHLNRINETASNAFQHIEQLDDKANAATRKPLKEIAAGLHSVLQYIQEGNFKEAASWFLKTKSVANSLHPSQHDVTEVKGLLENVISLQKEFEAYRDKKMVTPNERENRLEQFFDAYKDSEEKLKTARR
jgi:hypothetical protein